LLNALKIVNKTMTGIKVVINGVGAAGIAITKLLRASGVENMLMCDSNGIIYVGCPEGMNKEKDVVAKITNKENIARTLKDALVDADVFIGVSVANILTEEYVQQMHKDPIVFALANPNPEILPEQAKEYGVKVIATGRSDYANQVN